MSYFIRMVIKSPPARYSMTRYKLLGSWKEKWSFTTHGLSKEGMRARLKRCNTFVQVTRKEKFWQSLREGRHRDPPGPTGLSKDVSLGANVSNLVLLQHLGFLHHLDGVYVFGVFFARNTNLKRREVGVSLVGFNYRNDAEKEVNRKK